MKEWSHLITYLQTKSELKEKHIDSLSSLIFVVFECSFNRLT